MMSSFFLLLTAVAVVDLPALAGQQVAGRQAANQQADTAYSRLDEAYQALRMKGYDRAVVLFEEAIVLAPERASIRTDLAYTLLKIGEVEAARDQFAEAMRLDPADEHVALEYGFLCYETQEQVTAR